MSVSERYAYEVNRVVDENKENTESPQKLYRYLDTPQDKENVVQNLQASKNGFSFTETREVLKPQNINDLNSERFKSPQGQEFDIPPLKDTINVSPISRIPDQRAAFNQSISLSQSNYIPQNNLGGMQRSFTAGERLQTAQTFQLNQNDIIISVTDPSRKGNAISKTTYYRLQGSDRDGPITVTRSHDDFIRIRNVLVKRWPGCYIPSVPPKRVMTKVDFMFLEGRRKELEMFTQKITELPHLHYSREYQLFLRSSNPNFEADLIPFQNVTYDDIIMRYKAVFKQPLELRATPEAEKIIEEFRTFLTTIHASFKEFKKVLKKTVLAKRTYYEQLLSFHDVMSRGYEKSVLTRIEPNFETSRVFNNTQTGDLTSKIEGVKQASEMGSIEYIYAWMKAEAREIKAFLEAIQQKDLYESKMTKATNRWASTTRSLERNLSGKSSLTSLFKNRDNERATLEGRAVSQDKEAKQLEALYSYIILILAHSEIDRFKQRKSDQYHHVINLSAQYELNNLAHLTDYWNTILTIDTNASSRRPSMNRNSEI